MKKLLHMILDKIQTGKESPETQLTIIESNLADISATVNSLMYDAEREFLELYQKFQTLGSQTVELTEKISQTTTLAGDREEEMRLAGMNDFSKESVEQLRSFHRDISDSLRILDSGWHHLETLSDLCTEADSLTRFLNDMNLQNNHRQTTHEIIKFHDIVRQQMDHVQRISLKFHEKALNSMLNASHFSDMGRTLECFARGLTQPVRESSGSANRVNPLINRIRALAAMLKNKNRPPLDEGTSGLPQGAQPLSDSNTLFKATSSAASKMAHKLESSITNTRFALSFIPDFSNRMALLLRQSEGVLCSLSPGEKKHQGLESN